MTDHKFTDDDVIKALEICTKSKRWGDCEDMGCPAATKHGCYFYLRTAEDYEGVVQDELLKDALALINRQKAEIEEKSKNITYAAKELIRLDRERSEVIKEFANNVVQELWKLNWHYGQLPCSEEDKTIQRAIKECIAVVERNTKVMTEEAEL